MADNGPAGSGRTGTPAPGGDAGALPHAEPHVSLQARACPLCGPDVPAREYAAARYDERAWGAFAFASRKLPEYMHYRLQECSGCGLLYANPAPAPEALARAYEAAAYDSAAESRYAAHTYAGLLRASMPRFAHPASALDIGCGDGAFLAELLALGFGEVTGIEPSVAPIAAADEAVRPYIRHGMFDRAALDDKTFTLITCMQTIEHVPDPLTLCRRAHALLKPGGCLMLVCHDRRAPANRLLGRRSPIYDIEHLQLFSAGSACILLERAGFHSVSARRFVNCYPLSYMVKLAPLPRRPKSAALAALSISRAGRIPVPMPAGNLAVLGWR